MPTLTTTWATLKFAPAEPKASTINPDWAPQHMATVAVDDEHQTEARIYFSIGLYSHLVKGDQVMLEWDKGKWRLSKTQTPELVKLLKQRESLTINSAPSSPAPAPPSPQPSPAPPSPSPSLPTADRWTDEHRTLIYNELKRRAAILAVCHREIEANFMSKTGEAQISEAALRNYAIALFNDLKPYWNEI